MKHTKEPWYVFGNGHCVGGPQSEGGAGEGVAMCGMRARTEMESQANARRIVAAVNACCGLPTEALEARTLDETVGRLVRQNADLLAAVDTIFPPDQWPDLDGLQRNVELAVSCTREEFVALRDAIAKAKEG